MLYTAEDADAALNELDSELEATIARLTEVRAEISRARHLGAPADLSVEAFRAMEALGGAKGLAVVEAQMLPAPELDQFMTELSKLSPEYAMVNDKLAAMPADNPAADVAGVVQEMTGSLEKFSCGASRVCAGPASADPPRPATGRCSSPL